MEIKNLDIFLVYCEETGSKSAKNAPGGSFQVWTENQICIYHKSCTLCIQRFTQGRQPANQQNQWTARTAHTPVAPGQP